MKTLNVESKIKGKKIIKKLGIKAQSNYDLDHLLQTEDFEIYGVFVGGGSRYFNIDEIGISRQDLAEKYGIMYTPEGIML